MVGFNVIIIVVIVWSFGKFARIKLCLLSVLFCFRYLLCLFGLISILWTCFNCFWCWNFVGQWIWGWFYFLFLVLGWWPLDSLLCLVFLCFLLMIKSILCLEFTYLECGPSCMITICMSVYNFVFTDWSCWSGERER